MTRSPLRSIVIAVLGAAALCATGAAGAAEPTLQAVTDPSFVPFEMQDPETGEMIGFDMDILAEVAERAGFTYNLNTMNFNGIIPALQTGTADVAIAGITITAEREKIVDFTNPYYDSGLRILVPRGSSVETLKDLVGKAVGTKIGSTSYNFLQRKLGDRADITPYPGTADMYLALNAGSVDAVLYDAPNVSYFAKTQGEGRVKVVGPLYEGQQYGIAFKDGSKWVDDANDALAAMREDGTYEKIYRKWFGEPPKQ